MDPASELDAVHNVGLMGGSVAYVGSEPIRGDVEIDAVGLVVAPGFIDMNMRVHSLEVNRVRVLDGVTTALETEGGGIDLDSWYEERAAGGIIHYGGTVDFWEARLEVMGNPELEGSARWKEMEGRKATPEQIAKVLAILERGLANGALGVGIPLEYVPAATHAELLEVFRLAARYEAPVHVHLRSWGYDERRIRSYGDLYEVFGAAIATDAKIHILHINSSYNEWTPIGLDLISKARSKGLAITTDMYPYAYGACPSGAAYFDDWESYPDEYFSTKLRLASSGEWLTRDRFRQIREASEEVPRLCYDNTEEMVRLALESPLTMVASDGSDTHPRTAGTFSRVLGRYVREQGALTLMEALRKMTIMPARHLERRAPAMVRKGRLGVGADADIVVFDPDTIRDQSTVLEPLRPSRGMRYVLVDGQAVVWEGQIREGVLSGQEVRAKRHE